MNEVRFWVESRTCLVDEQSGDRRVYAQCASCKSEDTFAEHDLFYDDNYDFLPIFGPEYGLVFRRKAWLNPNYRSCVRAEEMWGGQVYHVVEGTACEELATPGDVIRATHAFRPIVAQTELRNSEFGLRAVIEYPVKTMNTHVARNIYQVDTGPVAFPDLSRRHERPIDALSLAFVAFNVPHFAGFVIEEPTAAVAEGGDPRVYHYSRRVTVEASNRLYVVD